VREGIQNIVDRQTVRAGMMVGLIGMAPSLQRTVTKPRAQQLQGLGFNSQ